MKLIIGLGNPGKKYEFTRHNVGFMAVDKLREVWNFPEFEFNKKFNAEISEGILFLSSQANPASAGEVEGSNKILMVKPRTFMNLSGEAVKKILDFYKLTSVDIIVIHDDLDIELGKYKISENSRSAGHNGVQNIIDRLGTQNFKRIRIGIEDEEKRKNRLTPSDEFVLQNFTSSENKIIQKISGEIIFSIQKILNT